MVGPPPPDYELTRPRDELDHSFIAKYPSTILVLACFYVWFVKIYGPKLMANKQPFKLKNTIRIYNFLQVCLNGYTIVKICIITPEIFRDYWNHHCHYYNFSEIPTYIQMTNVVQFILFTKVIDFMDSILLVMLKKFGQLSFLHVYHHAIVAVSTAYTISYREGLGIAVLLLNCVIHVIMYAYYCFVTFDSCRKIITKYKPIITKLQIIQFMFMLLYLVSAYFRNCTMGPLLTIVNPIIIGSFLLLFIKFYIEAYINKKNKTK